MIITGVDTETTGLDQEKGHRIIEICMRSYDSETEKLTSSYVTRINPHRPIDAGAQRVHGIGIHDLVTCPSWEDVAPDVAEVLKNTDLLVAHNMVFDGVFIVCELMRVGITPPEVETFCTMENARWATPLGKKPNLGELCFSLNVPYDASEAHSAEYDVDVMMKCLFRGIHKKFYTLPDETKTTVSAA